MIEIDNIILYKNNIDLRKLEVKPAGFNFEYMHFKEINTNLRILIDRFNDRFITKIEFVSKFLYIHPFLDGNGRTAKILMI